MPLLGIAPTETNLRALTAPQAKYIAYSEYWINRGVTSALPQYRTILADSFFLGGGVKSLGYTTISALNLAKPSLSVIANNRLKYLQGLKNWEANKNGWLKRLQNITNNSIKFTSENLGVSTIILLVLGLVLYFSFKPK
jgi:lysozyme family protein